MGYLLIFLFDCFTQIVDGGISVLVFLFKISYGFLSLGEGFFHLGK
jgi:hypothetical protein